MSEKMASALNELYAAELASLTEGPRLQHYAGGVFLTSCPPRQDLYGALNTSNGALKRMGERGIRLIVDGHNNRFEVCQ